MHQTAPGSLLGGSDQQGCFLARGYGGLLSPMPSLSDQTATLDQREAGGSKRLCAREHSELFGPHVPKQSFLALTCAHTPNCHCVVGAFHVSFLFFLLEWSLKCLSMVLPYGGGGARCFS
jgi:hypothetical protein